MRLLVIRTSAMGDVALTTPALMGLREQHPEVEIVLVTRPAFFPFFNSIDGLTLFGADLSKRHKGFLGIIRLFRDIRKYSEIDHVIDLHDVLRSQILRTLFRLIHIPATVIDKGRREKKDLISGKNKVQLRHTVERYCDVFTRAGFPVTPSKEICIIPSREALVKAGGMFHKDADINIGVAPYAKHELKMWPEDRMIRLMEMIAARFKVKFWLFGGKEDLERMTAFRNKAPDSVNLIGLLTLDEELAVISKLNLMIAMDSSNMHMAALVGTRVISVWGGTDPLAGFGAWMQPDDFSVRIPVHELTCRPCTIYGRGKSKNGLACMNRITPEMVFRRIEKISF